MFVMVVMPIFTSQCEGFDVFKASSEETKCARLSKVSTRNMLGFLDVKSLQAMCNSRLGFILSSASDPIEVVP